MKILRLSKPRINENDDYLNYRNSQHRHRRLVKISKHDPLGHTVKNRKAKKKLQGCPELLNRMSRPS